MIKAQFVRRNLIKLIAPQGMTKKYYDNGPRSELLMLQSDQKAVTQPRDVSQNEGSISPKWLAQQEDDIIIDSDVETNERRTGEGEDGARKREADPGKNGFTKTLAELAKPEAYKPFLLLLVTFTLQQSTGTFAIIFYAVNVFKVKQLTSSGNNWVCK